MSIFRLFFFTFAPRRSLRSIGWPVGIGVILLSLAPLTAADPPVDFRRDIRPLLSNHCFACHGPDRVEQENDLRLDQHAAAIESAIVPGDAAASEFIARISSDDPELRMPPVSSKREPLTPRQIALLRRWIDEGARYESHWAYRPIERPELPQVETNDWELNPIDRFVIAKQVSQQMRPGPPADSRSLARRLSFDLRGLPPSPDEVQRLQADATPAGVAHWVDQMLDSPAFGERMAMLWLDLVRFADTCGYHGDQHRDIWAYRDYVVDSFQKNKPFDQFTVEQLAGDLLPNPTDEQLIGSGYNRLLQTTEEGGAQPAEYRAIYAADRVRNVSTVWLGSTLGCAQCHDHKFDPFTMADFYRFAAFFADINEPAVGRHAPNLALPTPEQSTELAALNEKIAQRKAELQSSATGGAGLAAHESAAQESAGKPEDREAADERLQELVRRQQALSQQITRTLVTERVEPRMTRILPRGNWLDESGSVVLPGVPEQFGAMSPSTDRLTRLELAHWIVAPENPLTARVFVNHLWRLLFGQGLVRTPEDFGSQGDFPTHPELLDWLASEFRDSGWDVKHLVRLIATSRTYRQSSLGHDDQRARDPYNDLLTRQNRFRLDAELVRDNALAVSGLLVTQVGGPSVKPYQPVGYWSQLNFPKRTYQPDLNANQYRRGLYTYWCRTFLHPGLAAFDAPTREECTARRPRSNTPLQALVLLNDPSYVEAAGALGRRMMAANAGSRDATIDWAFQQVLSRPASQQERLLLGRLYDQQRQRYETDQDAASQLVTVGQQRDTPESPAALAEQAAWTSVARVLLNLHETITRP